MPDIDECGKLVHEECGGRCFEPAGHTWSCTPDHQRGCSVFKNIPLKLALLPLFMEAMKNAGLP
jgi:hypothetical protein